MRAGGLGFFAYRVVRRLGYEARVIRFRLLHRFPALDRRGLSPVTAVRLWDPLATPPGDPARLPHAEPGAWRDPSCLPAFEEVVAHRWRVLSPEPLDWSKGARPASPRFLSWAEELPSEAVAAYRPIDWHSDPRSGYRWPSSAFYLDAVVAPALGVDIKVPWELSKFVHVGLLARGDLERGAHEFLLQVLDWIDANPRRSGVNWTSTLVVALRAVNWIWGLRLFEPMLRRYPAAVARVVAALRDHGRHIDENPDYYVDLTDDHYIGDVAGLVFLGAAFPAFPEADRWLRFGLQELASEMERQVYADGYHQMMSTGYHRFVAEMFAACAALADALPEERRVRLRKASSGPRRPAIPPAWRLDFSPEGRVLPAAFHERLLRMARLLGALAKPNGLMPQFGDNDSARFHRPFPAPGDDSRDPRSVLALAGRLSGDAFLERIGASQAFEAALVAGRSPLVPALAEPFSGDALFPDAQIAVLRRGPAYLAVTCGPNGMKGHGGHGHNDRLSFELNVHGLDVVVDGGCPFYTSDPGSRNRYRSTAGHSTLAVENLEQDPWPEGLQGLFLLPERRRPLLRREGDGSVTGEHYGYRLPHRRTFSLTEDALILDDHFESEAPRFLYFNLDPEIRCEPASPVRWIGRRERLEIEIEVEGAGSGRLEPGCFGVGYGLPVLNSKLGFAVSAPRVRTRFSWRIV